MDNRRKKTVDKRELLLATLQGEKTDRVPCGFWFHFPEEKMHGEASVKAHLEYYESIDADMLKIMNEHLYELDREVANAKEWRNVTPLKIENTPYVDFIAECKMIKEQMPSDVPLLATIHGVFVSAYHSREEPNYFSNPDNLITLELKEDPESVSKGLYAIADTLLALIEELATVGIDGIYYAALGAEEYRFDRDLFEKYVIPLDKYVIDGIRNAGMLSFLHICKDQVMLPAYQGIDADVVNWAVHECKYPLSTGRDLFPGKTLLGGFDDRSGVLVDGTEQDIAKKADAIIQEVGREKFIFGADCTLPDTAETWRIKAVHEIAKKY